MMIGGVADGRGPLSETGNSSVAYHKYRHRRNREQISHFGLGSVFFSVHFETKSTHRARPNTRPAKILFIATYLITRKLCYHIMSLKCSIELPCHLATPVSGCSVRCMHVVVLNSSLRPPVQVITACDYIYGISEVQAAGCLCSYITSNRLHSRAPQTAARPSRGGSYGRR